MFALNEHKHPKHQQQQKQQQQPPQPLNAQPALGLGERRPSQAAQLKGLICKLRLRPSSLNAKLREQSQQLCAKLNQLQYGRLRDDLQRSLGRLVQQASGAGQARAPRKQSGGGGGGCGVACETRRTRSSGNAAAELGRKTPLLLQRSLSLNPRHPLARPPAVAPCESAARAHAPGSRRAGAQSASVRRNEWATRSLRPALAPTGDIGEPRPRETTLAARLAQWPSLAGGGGGGKPVELAARKSQQQEQLCSGAKFNDLARASVASLVGSATARRKSRVAVRQFTSGARFVFVAGLQLLLLLVALIALPGQPARCAPIGQFASAIRPIWLADGLMDVSDADSSDAAPLQFADPRAVDAGDETSIAHDLLDRMNSLQQAEPSEQQMAALLEYAAQQQQTQQQQARPETLLFGPPKRSWFSLASRQERLRPQAPTPAMPYMKRRASEPAPVVAAAAVAPTEHLWIERRRLDRDRALEPPAWLRTRPIRRGFGGAPASWARTSDAQPNADADEGQRDEAQAQAHARPEAAAERPAWIRQRASRGRQSRESKGELYEQIVRHLVDEAVEGSSILDRLYDELDARASKGARAGLSDGAGATPAAGPSLTGAGSESGANEGGPSEQQRQQPSRVQAQQQQSQLLQQQLKQQQESALVVAGDEISSEDDVTPVDPTVLAPAQLLRATSLRKQPPPPAHDIGPIGYSNTNGNNNNNNNLNNLNGANENNNAQAPGQQQPQFGRLIAQPQAASDLATLDAGGLVDMGATGGVGGLIALMQQAGLGQPEPSFHVVEEIDQVDGGQEIAGPVGPAQLAAGPAGAPRERLDKRSVELDASLVGDFENARERLVDERASSPASWPSATANPDHDHDEEEEEGQEEQEDENKNSDQEATTNDGDDQDAQSRDNADAEDQQEGPEEAVPVPPVVRRAAFGRRRDLGARRAAPDNSLAATAVRLIRSGYFTRAQLILFATKLRVFLETRLGLARGAISGLFPLDAKRRLLVELNTSRLGAADRERLAQGFGWSPRAPSSLVLSWPGGKLAPDNPLPVLSAILGALYDEEATQEERMQFEEAAGREDADGQAAEFADAEAAEAVVAAAADAAAPDQINELPVARGRQRQLPPGGGGPLIVVRAADAPTQEGAADAREGPAAYSSPSTSGGRQQARRFAQVAARDQRPQLSLAQLAQLAQLSEVGPALGLGPNPASLDRWPVAAAPATWDEYYQSRRVAALASYLGALYGLSAWQQQQRQQLAADDPLGLWARDLELASGQRANKNATETLGAAAAAAASAPAQLYGRLLAALGLGGHQGAVTSERVAQLASPSARTSQAPDSSLWANHLLGLVLGLAMMLLVVKLVTERVRAGRRATGKRRRLSGLAPSSGSSSSGASSGSSASLCSRARLWSTNGRWWPARGPASGAAAKLDAEPSEATIRGETSVPADKQHALGRAFAGHRLAGLSADSGLETIADGSEATGSGVGARAAAGAADGPGSSEKIRRSFEHLTRRLTRLLSLMRASDEHQRAADTEADADGPGARKLDEGATEGAAAAATSGEQQQFRSSTSYIRSLIEALTKAASAQMSASAGSQRRACNDDDDDDDDEDDDQEAHDKFAAGSRPLLQAKRRADQERQQQQQQQEMFQKPDDESEILMAQMDISAAHLILDYMEKHLVDKERLRREWLELNGAAAQQTAAGPSHGQAKPANKASQLVLQRLARVALNEDNYHKNRNPNVVPFDRNRVRLGVGRRASGPQAGSEPSAPSSPPPQGGNGNGAGHGNGNGKQRSRNQQARGRNGLRALASDASDYINASFIYDDDPRRPTHIIAQGPKEQTCGQFWQMVWEQEVSVIVMLTRLNENGAQMCHCYWPTQVGAPPPPSAGAGAPMSAPDECKQSGSPPLAAAGAPNGAGRRGSVTSVFSGLAGARHSSSSAVLAGAMNDNSLYFEVPLASACGRPGSRSSAEDELELPAACSAPETSACAAPDAKQQQPQQRALAKQQQQQQDKPRAWLRLEVRLISEHVSSSDWLVRNMCLINRASGETRTISQFHYLAWQEARTPDSVRSFLQFRRKVHKSYRNPASPILVHCSDGAGRSGTYALIDIILERIRNGAKEIDLRATLEHLRDQRAGLCETQTQFEFVLVALAEEIQIILNALPQ